MLEFIRSHRRLMQFLLLLFIVPSFALFGLESYTNSGGGENVVATVGDRKISRQEWEAAQREQMDRMRQMFGDQFDPQLFDTPEARRTILDNLIAQHVLAAEATENKLSVPDRVLQQTILEIPGLTGPDGKFDGARYKELLGMQGLTPPMYEARLRQELTMQQVNAAVQSTAFAPRTVSGMLSDLNEQERVVRQLTFKPSDYLSKVQVTDEMIRTYYEKNAAQFRIPERIEAEYVVLSADALASQIPVSDADIKSYYDQNAKRYVTEEQRRASHILITLPKDATDAQRTAAKAKAESLLQQVRAKPEAFAEIAKANSQDPGSAENGGDLGFFGKGAMVKPFEDAAFGLKKGETSGVVESDFGFHIIRVTDAKAPSGKPLEEVREDIAAEIRKQQAAKKYAELAESFSNTVYEQSDSLKPVADKLGLKIQTAADLTREPDPALAPTVWTNHPKFLKAIFSEEAIKGKNNTEAIEVAPNTMIAGRVKQFTPSRTRPLEEVKGVIRDQVLQQQADALAEKAGKEKLAALQKQDDTAGFSAQKAVSRTKPGDIDSESLAEIFKADTAKLPAYVGVDLDDAGYSVFRIEKVGKPSGTDVARRQQEQQQINQAVAQQETAAYINALKKKADVEILQPVASSAQAKDEE